MKQRGEGLHLRQFARTFLVDDGSKRVVFVSVDGAMISHAVKQNVSAIGHQISFFLSFLIHSSIYKTHMTESADYSMYITISLSNAWIK